MDVRTEKSAEGVLSGHQFAPDIQIRDLSSAEELRELEELQVLVWGGGPDFVVPVHVLQIVGTTGGIVLGAFDGKRPVGFAFGFLGRRGEQLYHASHMLGIHPAYQGRGIGAALKWAQRERALAQELDLMTWTFDPLESRNAYFNLHKLGVTSHTYKENVYGELGDDLNQGLPSDRLLVEWWLREVPRAGDGAWTEGTTILEDVDDTPSLRLRDAPDDQVLRIDAPRDIQRLKRESRTIAEQWRLTQRAAMNWALARGYTVRDFSGGSFILKRGEEHDNAD